MFDKISFFLRLYNKEDKLYKFVLANYKKHEDDIVIKNSIFCSFIMGTHCIIYFNNYRYYSI